MNILTFGVKIDPSGAESGSRAARAAMDKLKDTLRDVQKAAGSASEALGKTGDKGAFTRISGAASAAARAVTGAFSGMVRAVTGSVSGITKALGSIGLALDGLRMITAPMRGFLSDVIGNASEMETFRNQWAYILGSVDKAREKMASLQQFANATPFDLPGVTEAALMMADLKDKALAGEAGLKRIGDAAARANQPIQELASRIVRLSGNLERGAGGGDELRALTEWRIFKPAAAAKIADLSTDASKFKDAMKIVISELNRSENAMKLMSVTWKGLTSTMGDSWGALKTAIGEPLLEGLKPLLVDSTKMIDAMTAQIRLWAPEIKQVGLSISAAFKVMQTDGGISLTLRAAADLFVEVLKRGFQILGKMLENAFDIVSAKFTAAMKVLASYNFWKGVGEALVSGVKAALEAMKQSTSDDFKSAIGMDPEAEQRRISDEMARRVESAKRAQANLQKGTYSQLYADPNLAESEYAADRHNIATMAADIKAMSQKITGATDSPLPEQPPAWLSPLEINDSLGPLPKTPAMLEYDARFDDAMTATLSLEDYLQKQQDDVLRGLEINKPQNPNILLPEGGTGGPQGELFPENNNTGDYLSEALNQKKELTDATLEYGEAVEDVGRVEQQTVQETLSQHDRLLASWKDLGGAMDTAMVNISESISGNIAGALTDVITGAKSAKEAFSDMAGSIVSDIVNITMKLMVQYFYSQLLGMIPGGGAYVQFAQKALGASVMHSGGVVGGPSETRSVSADTFAGAVRYHSGGNVGKNEVPAILEKGETVLTREKASAIEKRLNGKAGEQGGGRGVTIINLSDPNAAQAELARNPDAILNIIGSNLPKVRELVNHRRQ